MLLDTVGKDKIINNERTGLLGLWTFKKYGIQDKLAKMIKETRKIKHWFDAALDQAKNPQTEQIRQVK